LWDRVKLIEVLSKVQGKELTREAVSSEGAAKEKYKKAPSSKVCPRCNNRLVLRNGKWGRFWGCEGYPKCKYTQN